MTRLALFLIGAATPRIDREAVLGDTIERFDEIHRVDGPAAARRWLWREAGRVAAGSLRHRLAARRAHPPLSAGGRSGLMSSVLQDVRYALRGFARAPGFTTIAILTLALGIGANTAMFAVVNAVLLKPLPFANADRLMLVHLAMPRDNGGFAEMVWSYPKYRSLVEMEDVFDETAIFADRQWDLSGDGEPEQLRGEVVTDRYLSVLGVQPVLGRAFTADEAHRTGADPVVMIGHGLWMRKYAGDAAVLGRRLDVGGVPHTVVGVLSRGFAGLSGRAEIWRPLAVAESGEMKGRQSHSYSVVARRRADVSEAAVLSALSVYGPRIDEANGEGPASGRPAASATARSLEASRIDVDLRRVSLVVLGAVGFVLLIACANITNLLVARAVARQREVAIRVALGARRARIVRQFAIESLLLSGTGATAGLGVAVALFAIAPAVLPDANVFFGSSLAPDVPRMAGAAGLTRIGTAMIGLDGRTLAFTAGLAMMTAVLVSILPAFKASLFRPAHILKAAGGTSTARGFGSRALLVGAEIAVALVLLAGAGLMLKSAMRLHATSIGVDPVNVLTAQIDLPSARYDAASGAVFQNALLDRVRALSGVESAGWGHCVPVSGGCNGTVLWFPDGPRDQQPRRLVGIMWATPGFFDALRIPVVSGRGFSEEDGAGRPKVALINETAARQYWPGDIAIGKRIAVGQGGFQDGAEVVGVVADVRYQTLEAAPGPDVYLPLAQSPRAWMQLVVRSQLDSRTLVSAVGRELRALDPNLPLVGVDIKTMEDRVGDAMWRTRVASWLLSAFAALAVLLTAIGVFGVMAQTVAQQTAEIGIRMALGAQRRDVLALVLGRAAIVTAIGLVVGLGAAAMLTPVLTTLLHDVTPRDPATLAIVALLLGMVSLAACYVPTRRAMRVDAVTALKGD